MAFLAGMLVVPIVIPLEVLIQKTYAWSATAFFLLALTEEFFKYAGAFIVALRTKYCDEPIDYVIYLITAALGFATLENILFLADTLYHSDVSVGLITLNFRFMGATLLHIVSSAVIGIFIGLSFYKSRTSQLIHTLIGLALAVVLHTFFNLFIMVSNGTKTFLIFSVVWLFVALIFLFLEKLKIMEFLHRKYE